MGIELKSWLNSRNWTRNWNWKKRNWNWIGIDKKCPELIKELTFLSMFIFQALLNAWVIITFVIAVEFYLIYVDWYVYYNNNNKLIMKGLFRLCKNTHLNDYNGHQGKIRLWCVIQIIVVTRLLLQFNLTTTDWCVRIYLLFVTCCYYTLLVYSRGLV